MKVLVAFPNDGQTGNFIAKAFKKLGCDVTHLSPKTDLQRIVRYLESNAGVLVVCSRSPELALVMGLRFHRKLVCWNTDVRKSLIDFRVQFGEDLWRLFKKCDAIYTMAKGQVCEYRNEFPGKHVRWLSQGIDPETHLIPDIPEGDLLKYDCDVMFAGSYKADNIHGKFRENLLNEISKRFSLKLYGYKDKIFDEEHNKAVYCAQVALGCSAYPEIERSMSVRDYKILGAGGILLTRRIKGIENWFGDNVFYFDEVEDCLKSIDRILNLPADIKEELRIESNRIAHKEHRYVDRCKVILDDLQKGLF
jgi:spore maturation protein CgeB